MRVKMVPIQWPFFKHMLSGHPMSEVVSDYPDDAEVIGVEVIHDRQMVRLLVHSTTFDDLAPGMVTPDWYPTFTLKATELQMLANLVRHAPCMHCGKMPYDA